MLKPFIRKVSQGKNLSEEEAFEAMAVIMSGEVSSTQIAAYLAALRTKGETEKEVVGSARAMRAHALPVEVKPGDILDTAGTGGDGSGTFNISTLAALAAAGAGATVAKHGNRSVSSRCGSADLLAALGVNLFASPAKVKQCLESIGLAFLYAPVFHQAMKHAVEPRREIGIRTIFNLLGPLTNPAGATCQLVGVFQLELTEPMARALKRLGTKTALVVHGKGCLDEITNTGATRITELKGGRLTSYWITPEQFGLKRARLEDLLGGFPEENARISLGILEGEPGPKRDVVLLNSAAALVAAGKALDMQIALEMARESIDSGRALAKLKALVELTNNEDRG